jgi:hypothetical protein
LRSLCSLTSHLTNSFAAEKGAPTVPNPLLSSIFAPFFLLFVLFLLLPPLSSPLLHFCRFLRSLRSLTSHLTNSFAAESGAAFIILLASLAQRLK